MKYICIFFKSGAQKNHQNEKILWKSKQKSNLKSADDKQGVDVVAPELLGDLLQMFAWKSSGHRKERKWLPLYC